MIEIMEPTLNIFRDSIDYLRDSLKDPLFEPRVDEEKEDKLDEKPAEDAATAIDENTTVADRNSALDNSVHSPKSGFGSALFKYHDNKAKRNHKWGCECGSH